MDTLTLEILNSKEVMSAKILIVEDETKIAEALVKGLSGEGYDAKSVSSGEEALFLLSREAFDIIILDVMLPGRNGFEVLKLLRETGGQTPVLMLTARDSVEDRVLGLDFGADDYLTKPFAFTELVARVRVRLKRSKADTPVKLSFADLEMNLLTREIKRGGRKIELTLKEFDVLEYLMRHRNETVSREMLARDVWKETSRITPLDNVIDVHIARLRKKVDQDFSKSLIHTVRGVGFILKEET
jgi:two-component system, OmpR family, copper resistance phosphate regulon response regulator CusR